MTIMAKMKFTTPRATIDETLAFANAVRKAGGGNPLDALMPAVPEDASQCLIAKNLNFNCSVEPGIEFRGQERWVMIIDDKEIRDRIAIRLGLAKINFDHSNVRFRGKYAVVLPKQIGQVASDFDNWEIAAFDLQYLTDCLDDGDNLDNLDNLTPEAKEVLRTFTPYIEASVAETYKIGDINAYGELLL